MGPGWRAIGTVTLTLASDAGPIEVEVERIVAPTPDGQATVMHVAGAGGEEVRIPVRESEARIRALLTEAGGGDA
jgi:hypothetical protein